MMTAACVGLPSGDLRTVQATFFDAGSVAGDAMVILSTDDAGQGSGGGAAASANDSGIQDAGVLPLSDAGGLPQADAGLPEPTLKVRKGLRHEWVRVEPGTFLMGSAADRPCREGWGDRETQHRVTLTHPFEISTYEVTERLFVQVKGSGSTGCPECPVTLVTWSDAADYCNALSKDEGTGPLETCYENGAQKQKFKDGQIYNCPGFRLPTEAEFEYAYRAGTTTDFYNGDGTQQDCNNNDPAAAVPFDEKANEIAVNAGNSGDLRKPVGTKKPNAWGLYDMAGNAWNFCNDWWSADLGSRPVTDPWGVAGPTEGHSVRGGSYHYNFSRQRAAQRSRLGGTSPATGLRCVRTLP
jgi:formylglycine-generating enzyme required for sulfatase activity